MEHCDVSYAFAYVKLEYFLLIKGLNDLRNL